MNSRQLNINSKTKEKDVTAPTQMYNLRPRPTERNKKYSMMQMGQQSTISKPHMHIMLNQMGIKDGIKKFGEKGNYTLLKEINQLHERNARNVV